MTHCYVCVIYFINVFDAKLGSTAGKFLIWKGEERKREKERKKEKEREIERKKKLTIKIPSKLPGRDKLVSYNRNKKKYLKSIKS
jgi:hypothetical protein